VDFIKKNWGLLLVAVLSLGAAVFFALQMLGSMKGSKDSRTKYEQELDFFKGVQSYGVKLTESNKQTALLNAEKAKNRFVKVREQLHKQFRIETEYDADPYVAVQQLLTNIGALRTKLTNGGIMISQQNEFLSFEAYGNRVKPPNASQMPELFRQYEIVKEMVNHIVDSKVVSIDAISRPMDLEKQTEDLYTFVPIRLTVTGEPASISQLLNTLHSQSQYLFFIRKVEFTSQDQAPDGVLGGTGMTGGGSGTGGMGGGEMGGSGMDMGMGMGGRAGGMRGDMMGGDMMGGMGGGEMGMGNLAAMPKLLTREELKALKTRYVTATIRLDLVEFTTPDEEKGE
jgi:hypothetical protein